MKIVIPGGSGQVGTMLTRAFHYSGHQVCVLSRWPQPAPWRVERWDGATLGDWVAELEGVDAVINLAGRSVNCRYTACNRRRILESRVKSTQVIGTAIAGAGRPPRIWLQAGTATIYAHSYDRPNDDVTGIIGGSESNAPDTWRFSIDVARAWERTFNEAATPQTRKVLMRSAMTMSPDHGGIFDTLLRFVRSGLGGRAGDGRQYVSWIHEEDFVRAVDWLIEHDDLCGTFNLASPHPVPNAEFMKILREAWGAPFGITALARLLSLGAFALRTETELILKSRRVVPRRLTDSGFRFLFPTWKVAAIDLCDRWRVMN